MNQVYNICVYWKLVIRKANISFFQTFWTQIRLIFAKDIFIIPTENILITLGCEKVLTLQKPVRILRKNIQNINPR